MSAKISVAMTSYNGEKYILEQLESIRTQTRMPDEVIILDDRSSDNTVPLVESFIRENHLSGWNIIVNDKNLGWKKNFLEAVRRTTGDIVFFSDQDDVWLPEKIQKMSSAMIERKMGALYGTKEIIDGDGVALPERMDKTTFSHDCIQISFNESFYSIKTLGCCMCASREIVDTYIKLGFYEGGHDSQCGRLALLLSTLWYLDEPVIRYRIHGNNSSGIAADVSFGASSLEKRKESVHNSVAWMNLLLTDLSLDVEKREVIRKCCEAVEKREEYLKGNISLVPLLKYKKYYTGTTMLIGDFAYRHNINSTLGRLRWRISKR